MYLFCVAGKGLKMACFGFVIRGSVVQIPPPAPNPFRHLRQALRLHDEDGGVYFGGFFGGLDWVLLLFGLLWRLKGKGVHRTSARFRSDVGVAFDHLSAAPSKDRELHRLGYSAFAPLH